NFTWVGNQLMLERFSNGINQTGAILSPAPPPLALPGEASWDSSFGAARDTGLEVFDWFKTGDWEHSYALMIGNGAGLEPYTSETVEGQHDIYAYWSSEWVFGGHGPFQQGWKTFVWSQTGKRQLDNTDDGVANPTVHDRNRYGIGTRYRRGDWRVTAEYMAGKGMIFQGPEKPNFAIGGGSGLDGKANGYYADVGYYIPGSNWEADLRYDVYNRSTESAAIAAQFKRTTIGAQYHLNKKSRIILNYEIRSAETTGSAPLGPLVAGLAQIGNRYGIQITTIF
ncbi:MAG: hypothetical protein P8X48_03100, partial [Acidiferrobacteraceae bacterium]